MTTLHASPSLDSRLTNLERQLVLWRRLAVGSLGLLALAVALGFGRLAPGPLQGTSLTLLDEHGSTVTLSLRASGELEARFRQGATVGASHSTAGGLVLVSQQGREIVRLGDPSPRQLAP